MRHQEMYNTLKAEAKLEIMVGEDITESYTGARQNIFNHVDNSTSFENDKTTGLIISENGKLFENNIEYAYKHYILQKHAFPTVL
jgi:hypothetical protein